VNLIAENGDEAPSRTRDFETRGEHDPRARFRAVSRWVIAGDMTYGLFRADALDRVGPYRRVLMPDRLLLAELALLGEFHQVPEYLWSRRLPRTMSVERQRAAFFPGGGGLDTRVVPWWTAHAGSLVWRRSRARRSTLVHAPPPWLWLWTTRDAPPGEPGSGGRREGCGARDGAGGGPRESTDGAARSACAAA